MSDAPRRQLGGLTSLDRMRGAGQAPVTRPAPPAPAEPRPETTVAVAVPPVAPQQVRRPSDPAPAPANAPLTAQKPTRSPKTPKAVPKASQRPTTPARDTPTDKMTTYIPRETRERAKAAFRATGHLEGDLSFSAFIAAAIAAEVARREKLYNQGRPYAGGGDRLSAGRPLA